MSNNKLTFVKNPFNKPIEEVVSKLSYIPFIRRCHKFLHGISSDGIIIVPTEYSSENDFKASKGRPKLRSADLFFLPGAEPFIHGFQIDTTKSTVNYELDDDIDLTDEYLVFNSSRTKIREILFQLYKMFKDLQKFPKIYWNEHSTTIRIGRDNISFTIDDDIPDPKNPLPIIPTERVLHGGGGMGNAITLVPVPPRNTTLETIQAVIEWQEKQDKNIIEGIITRHNYAYKFRSNTLVPWTDVNIAFLKLPYDCLVIHSHPKEKESKAPETAHSEYKRITIINHFGFSNPYNNFKTKTYEEEVKEFIGLHLSKDYDTYMCLFDDTHAMYFTKNHVVFIDEKFVKAQE